MAGKSFQRRTSTTELSRLQATTLPTELAELERPALHTELEQLESTSLRQAALTEAALSLALESPTSSLELDTAQLEAASLTLFLVGPSFTTARPQGGVVRGELALLTQLDLDRQLELGQLVWLKLAIQLLVKGAVLPA